jgi:hypothetical protein
LFIDQHYSLAHLNATVLVVLKLTRQHLDSQAIKKMMALQAADEMLEQTAQDQSASPPDVVQKETRAADAREAASFMASLAFDRGQTYFIISRVVLNVVILVDINFLYEFYLSRLKLPLVLAVLMVRSCSTIVVAAFQECQND